MDNKDKIATGLAGVILFHYVADAFAHPLDETKVPQPAVAMVPVASSTVASVMGTFSFNTTTDERIAPAPPKRTVDGLVG